MTVGVGLFIRNLMMFVGCDEIKLPLHLKFIEKTYVYVLTGG